MEGKSAPDMFSMSRPSRDIRASKNPKGGISDLVSNPPSKKFQIRASVPSPRGPPVSKKAKTAVETLGGGGSSNDLSNKSQAGFGRDRKSSSNHLQFVSRSKRAAENGGDVTLDALRPPKKRKISGLKDAESPPPIFSAAGQVSSPKGEGDNGKRATAGPVATTGRSAPDYSLRNPKSVTGGNGGIKSSVPSEEISTRFSHQIAKGTAGTPNGLTHGGAAGVAQELREQKRALRPRPKPSSPKVKKRTRFHQVKLGESDGPRIVGRRIKVFWPLEKKFFYGYVKAFNGSKKLQHKIVYDDKDEEWLRLQNEKFGIELLPGEVFGSAPVSPPAAEAAVASDTRDTDDLNENEVVGNGLNVDVVDIIANTHSVEGTSESRIKPEGVYRRTRKGHNPGEEEKSLQSLEAGGRIKQKKASDGSGKVGKVDESAGLSEQKEIREGDDKSRKGAEGEAAYDEGKKNVEKKSDVRKKRATNDKYRGPSGHANANLSAGHSGIRERRKRTSEVSPSNHGDKAMASEGTSNGRRKRLGKEMIRMGVRGSLQFGTRYSNLAEMGNKKSLRNRTIRDNDRLFSSVKSSGSRRRSVESKPAKVGLIVPDTKQFSNQALVEEDTEVDNDEIAVQNNQSPNVRKWKQTKMSSPSNQEALGPFEAVMDAYREALSGSTDVFSSANCGAEKDNYAEAVREDDGALPDSGPLSLHDPDRVEDMTEIRDGADGSMEKVVFGQRLEGELGENDLPREESSTNKEGARIVEDASAPETLLATLIPSSSSRSESENSPEKVYRRVKKFQRDKVYRRLKGSGSKVANKESEPAPGPGSLVRVPPYFLSLSKLSSAPEVFFYFASIAGLGSCHLRSFYRIALCRLQHWGDVADYRLQVGTFYGAPSICSLLRVSWSSAQWLTFILESVTRVERESSAELIRPTWALKTSELQHLNVARPRFKRQGASRLNVSQLATALRQFLDPLCDQKFLSVGLPFLRRFGFPSRRARRIPRRSPVLALGASRELVLPPFLDEAGQSVVMTVDNLTLPCGPAPGDLSRSGQCLLSFDTQWRPPSYFNVWISSRRSTHTNVDPVLSLEAGSRAWSQGLGQRSQHNRNRSFTEVGPCYGRGSLQSVLTASTSGHPALQNPSISLQQSSGVDNAFEQTSVPLIVEEVSEAVVEPSVSVLNNDRATSPSQLGLSAGWREETELMLPSDGVDSVRRSRVICPGETSLFPVAWYIDISKFRDADWSRFRNTRFIYRGSIPRPLSKSVEVVLSHHAPPALPSVSAHLGFTVDREYAGAPTDSVGHFVLRGARSSPCKIDNGDSSGLLFLNDCGNREAFHPGDPDRKIIGAHYGSPSIFSLLRVSKDFLVRLLTVPDEAPQTRKVVSVISTEFIAENSGSSPRPMIEGINDDEELSDQDDRILHTVGAEVGLGEGSACEQEPAVLIGEDSDSVQTTSRSFGPMKKGRRTGKVLKRGFSHVNGDAIGREGVAEDDALSGRPHPKRVREDDGTVVTEMRRENESDVSGPLNDVDGRGSMSTMPSSHDKHKASASLPRMNVLKLRRCPTNKGVWLVAGNSCGAPQDSGSRASGVDTESIPSDFRDSAAGRGDLTTPLLDTGRKRPHDRSLEFISLGRTENNGISTLATGGPGLGKGIMHPDCQDPVAASSGLRSLKPSFPRANSPEVWYDCGIASINGNFPDGMETRKRRRKGPSPIASDDGISEQSTQRSADSSWGVCTANVLITKSDRCIRETGATVELQSGHGGSCSLKVSLHGESRFDVKADQPIASGTTNKFTHSVMWRSGKAWSLEFVDKRQWQHFKDLHEECFQRNARAASVRHIPIPGVKAIQDGPKPGVRFTRPMKYIRQVEDEAEIAFSNSRIVYDMDSEDEDWLSHVNNEKSSARGTRLRPKVDEDTLERVVDKLEKSSFIRHDEPMSPDTAVELCHTLGSQEAIKAIHSHWLEKRQRKGMALVRHFQPAPWEQYQQQVQAWQAKLDHLQEQSPTATKQQLQSVYKRPPLFAFCLRPRGLDNRNKMQKQRSQRKQGLGGSSSRQWALAGSPADFVLDSPSKRHAGIDSGGGFYGTRRLARQRLQEDAFPDSTPLDLTDSFDALAGDVLTPSADAMRAAPMHRSGVAFPPMESSSVVRIETPSSSAGFNLRTKKLGRKAKKMKLIAAAEESRRKRQLRAQEQAHLSEKFKVNTFPVEIESSSLGTAHSNLDGNGDASLLAKAIAAEAHAKAKRERATALRSHAQALHAIADAAMHKAVAAVIAADAMHVAERTVDDAVDRHLLETLGNDRQQQISEGSGPDKDDLIRPWNRAEVSGGTATFGSWRRALNSAASNKGGNQILSKGSSSKPGLISDMDDALLPVASWSQELGAGLGTRLLQTGEVSPQKQKYSPLLVEGLANNKSPGRAAVRADGLVSLGRTRGESMMAMLTR